MYKHIYTIIILVSGLLISACGKKTKTEYVYVQPSITAAPVDEVARVVSETNDLRLKQGSAPLVPGLVCSLYNNTGSSGVFPNTATSFPTTLPSTVASWVYLGEFNVADGPTSNGLDIMPSALKNVYKNDYAIRCSGQIVITKPDYYEFVLRSDDAALVYVGGTLVTGLNTLHSPTTTTGTKFLSRGIHSFRLDYMQDGGQQSLQLNVPANQFYR